MMNLPISVRLSNAQHPVVPRVVDTKNGYKPFSMSASIAFSHHSRKIKKNAIFCIVISISLINYYVLAILKIVFTALPLLKCDRVSYKFRLAQVFAFLQTQSLLPFLHKNGLLSNNMPLTKN